VGDFVTVTVLGRCGVLPTFCDVPDCQPKPKSHIRQGPDGFADVAELVDALDLGNSKYNPQTHIIKRL
jgi:hypothetical protein